MNNNNQTLSAYLSSYESALHRLTTLGVRVDGTRLHTYQKILQRAIEREKKQETAHQGSRPFINALIESSEIIDIAKISDKWFRDDVLQKMQSISDGQEFMQPTKQDQGRDYAFEFSTAATLDSVGQFAGFSEHGGDLTVGEDCRPAECKRISSLKSLSGRLRSGRKKLDNLLSSGLSPGVIIVDMTNPIRDQFGFMHETGDDALSFMAEEHLSAFMDKFVLIPEHLHSLARESTLGLVFRYVTAGISGKAENVRRTTIWQAASLHEDASKENSNFISVAQHFGQGPLRAGTRQDLDHASRHIND